MDFSKVLLVLKSWFVAKIHNGHFPDDSEAEGFCCRPL